MDLPKGVHKVAARGREYFYFQIGRGTPTAGPRIRLPDDPHLPEFWNAIRQAQGVAEIVGTGTIKALIDAYLTSPDFAKCAEGTRYRYRRSLQIALDYWGDLSTDAVRPVHIQALMDQFAATPGKANLFLSVMRVISGWGRKRDFLTTSLVEGVDTLDCEGGHKPWTPEQIKAAHEKLTGVVRKGVLLYLYTGQRGSDVVRLGPTDLDDDGFRLRQRKTGREVWCPVVPELKAEMATWERRPGPYLLQPNGRPFDRQRFWRAYTAQSAEIPELHGATLHGLRCTAVIRLRRAALSTGQIGDITGMSLATIERYCRFADLKTSGQAALVILKRTSEERDCKTLKKRKTKSE